MLFQRLKRSGVQHDDSELIGTVSKYPLFFQMSGLGRPFYFLVLIYENNILKYLKRCTLKLFVERSSRNR